MKKQSFLIVSLVLMLCLSIASIYVTPAIASIEPKVEIWKKFTDTSDPPPYEMRTEYHWDIEIGVRTSVDLERVTVSDRFGAELKIDSITIPGKTYTFTYPNYEEEYPTEDATVTISRVGTYNLNREGVTFGAEPYKFHIYWTGMSHKVHFEKWSIGKLKAGETITIIVRVSTDLNPGGKQEFTSPCEHCINSGAVLKAMWKWRWISRGTEQLCIKVQCAAELILDKFNDLNGNGIYDAGDVMIPDWRIHVTDPYGVTTTYLTPKTLEITEFGTYIVREDLPVGWKQTAVRVDGVYKMPPTLEVTVLINIGETHDVLYGNTAPPPPAKLILDKFNDINGNGIYDAGDVMIADWRIDVMDPHGVTTTYLTPKALEITDFGTYIITEDLPADWKQTAVRVDGSYIVPPTREVKVTIAAGETHDVLYGNWKPAPPPAKLIVDKFNDRNGNGVFDGGDVMIVTWEIYVTDPSGVTTTYHTPLSLDITLFGTYTIREDLRVGWVQTAVRVDGSYIVPPTREVKVTIAAGETHDVLYGNWIPPPPPIGIHISITPIRVTLGNSVTFKWAIESPPEVTPKYAELYLRNPDGVIIPLATYNVFPPWTGSYTWTSTLPTGTWRAYIVYYYTYLGTDYSVRAWGSFNVVGS